MTNFKNIPSPPEPPLTRIRRDGVKSTCPKCGSSMPKKYMLFGIATCLQPKCGYSK